MATTLKLLGQGSATTDADTTIVTNSGTGVYQITSINLTARCEGTGVRVTVNLVQATHAIGVANAIYRVDLTNPSTHVAEFGQGIVLEPGDRIVLNISTALIHATVTVSGVEIT